ncbi:EamA family transporter [Vibrio sp. V23_P3S9T160]|nr:EamA family transporter [Vibrio sp. V23_P3S9T160]OXX45188.1 EamA family transporter [Vibrio sp. V11_P1A41T118]
MNEIMIYGYLAIGTTLLLWSGFFLSLKAGASGLLTSADIALTRFLLPALLLSPLVWRTRHQLQNVPMRYLIGLFIGCGLPYLLVTSHAMHYVPVSDGSALVPGVLPLFVSGIAVLLFKQPLSRHRVAGLTLVVAGVGIFLYSSATDFESNRLTGHLMFLTGSLMWAVFTICARVANLHALISAGWVALLSTVLLAVLIALGIVDSYLATHSFAHWPWKELAGHILLQGVGAGLIAAFTYLYAVSTLGAERSAAFGSATPVVATLLAIPIFGEMPTPLTWIGLGLISLGSLVASNVLMKHDHSQHYRPPTHQKRSAKRSYQR